MQIAQEGAIQIFHEPFTGVEEIIVGVVGVLQLEVLEYRLKNEYGVDVRRRSMPYEVVRWVENEEININDLNLTSDTSGCRTLRATTCCCSPPNGASIGRSPKTPTSACVSSIKSNLQNVLLFSFVKWYNQTEVR